MNIVMRTSPGVTPLRVEAAGSRRLRILSVAPTSFFGDYGCHVRILEEATALQAEGHSVSILTYFKGDDVPGLRVIRTRPTPWHANYEVGSSRHKYAFDVLLAIRLARTLARERFDVIHAHLHEGALIGGLLGRLWRVPVVFDFQGSLTDEMQQHGFLKQNGKRLWFWKQVERAAESVPAAILTSTHHSAGALAARWPSKRVMALPDGVNLSAFRPGLLNPGQRAELRRVHGIRPDETVAVFLGLLAKHQGIDCILDAARLARERGAAVRWLVMGYPGVDVWRARADAVGLGDAVVFTGRVPYSRAPDMLGMGDIAVAPKLSLTEGSGKILNYMAMGLPTVAFDTPAQREYLGELGLYAPVGDAASLAQGVIDLTAAPERRSALGAELRARATGFGWGSVARRILDCYDSVLCRTLQTT